MMPRRTRVLLPLAALVASLATVALPTSLTPTAEAAKTCSTRATISNLQFQGREVSFVDYWQKSSGRDPKKVKTEVQRNVPVGGYNLKIVTCKRRDGSWRVMTVDPTVIKHNDVLVTTNGDDYINVKPATSWPTGYLWTVKKFNRTASKVVIEPTACRTKASKLAVLGAVKLLLGLPWKVSNPVSWGLYVASMALPDAPEGKGYCGAVAKPVDLSFTFTKRGKAVWTWTGTKTAPYSQTVNANTCDVQACWANYYDVMSVTKGLS